MPRLLCNNDVSSEDTSAGRSWAGELFLSDVSTGCTVREVLREASRLDGRKSLAF